MTKRLFAAIKYIPDPKISELINDLRFNFQNEKIKWTDINKLHLTLKFFGDTQISIIPDLIDQLNEISEKFNSFLLSTEKLDAFYRGKSPSVLYLKLRKKHTLDQLAESISIASETFGLPKEKRSFKAHITLARIKYIEDLELFNDLIHKKADQEFRTDSFLLYESKLTKKGPIYSVLKEFVI